MTQMQDKAVMLNTIDIQTNTLKVNAGDLASGVEKVIILQARVDDDTEGEIINVEQLTNRP